MEACPLCQVGTLEMVQQVDTGESRIQCSQYPGCRFSAESWEQVTDAMARFHHPVQPGHA